MKYIVYLILSLVVVGCSKEQCHNPLLLQAEQMVYQQPDSVVKMIGPCWNDTTLTEADRALFGLLFVESLHLSGLATRSDSVILFSRHYYEANGDRDRLARALLHQGIVLYGCEQTHEAVLCMKQAEQMAEKIENPAFKCYLFAVLGDVNDNVGNYGQTLRYYRQSLAEARRGGCVEWVVRVQNNMAQTFDLLGQTDSLILYTNKAASLARQTSGEVRATFLLNKATCHLRMNELAKAKDILMRAQMVCPTDRGAQLLSDVYLQEGDTLAAKQQWFQLVNSLSPAVSISSYRLLIDYLACQGETAQVAEYSRRLNEVYQDLYERRDAAGIINMQTQYDEQRKAKQQYQVVILLLSAILLLVVGAVGIVWYNRRRIDLLNARFVEKQMKYDLAREELTQMRLQHEREQQANSRQLKEVVSRLHAMANRGKAAADDDMNMLAQLSYALCPPLQLLLSPLNEKEQKICLLIRHNFLPTEIGTLTLSSPQTITNTRVRLLKKLFGIAGGAKQFDSRLKNL